MAGTLETMIRSAVTGGVGLLADFNRKRLPRATHPFLSGIHRPMTEELTLFDLAVTGTIPPALNGRYLRIGPNPVAPDPAGYHWFVGDGMVHGIAIRDGRAAWYRNRWIRSRAVAAALGEPPAPGTRNDGEVGDTVNTNVVEIAGRTWALVEAGSYPVELDETLDAQTYNPFDGGLLGSYTAHPHLDHATGEQHAIAYSGIEPGIIRHVVIARDGKVVREEPIAVRHGPSIHDCAITARYVVILDLPVTFSLKALIAGHRFPYTWNPGHPARVGLLPRNGTADDVIWCDVDPAYVFHVANAYDAADGRVVIDLCAYDSMFAEGMQGPNGRNLGVERWMVDPVRRKVIRDTIDPSPQEFPRIDERRFGRPCNYVYAMAVNGVAAETLASGRQLYKHDLARGTRETHEFAAGRVPGEFVFVPARPDAAEDEGWLIGLVIDTAQEKTDLMIIDAQDFGGAPVASIRVPHRIPPGFHGNWIPSHPG